MAGILSFGFGGAGSALAEMSPMTIKLAHVVNEKDGFHIAATRFKEIVEDRTGGAGRRGLRRGDQRRGD